MSIAARKADELARKLAGVEREFAFWRELSAEAREGEPPRPLEKHHRQVRRVTSQLKGFQAQVRARLGAPGKDEAALLADCRGVERDILELHRVWHFFRSKLAPRALKPFQDFLRPADELAWACYEPAQRRLAPGRVLPEHVKEPPLVFLNGGSSPFTSPRDWAYEPERVPNEAVRADAVIALIKRLPIPVIGVPWFQAEHLPEALVIAHEVGHDVAWDFRLNPRLAALLGRATDPLPCDRRDAWSAWLGEVFADVYGCLAAGPAFAGALIDFLATGQAAIAGDRRTPGDWGRHPPAALRVLLVLEVLRQRQFGDEAARLGAEWRAAYPRHAMTEFEPDLKTVAGALLGGPYPELGGEGLPAVLCFSRDDHEAAGAGAELLLQGLPPATDDARVLFAAVRTAYERDPGAYGAVDVRGLVAGALAGKTGVRAEAAEAPDPDDEAAGAELYRQWRADGLAPAG
ncbi:MAG TPA: hypothetical protein VFW33_24245 [Gemmataceae bacterium]|nr:hypothetical protein [Gemmataceae bacterium]